MIRFGVVGVGGFAGIWLQALDEVEKEGTARVGAAVVRNPARYARQVTALQKRGCAIYATLAEMLAQGRGTIDVVGVPTGIAQHAPLAVPALEAGYPVLIEKPVAATIQEVRELQEAERRAARWCAVGYQYIYSSTMQWLKEKLLGGQLGALREARTVIGWPRGTSYYTRNPWAGQLCQEGRWVLDGPATNGTAHHLTNMLYLALAGGGVSISSVRAELYRARAIPGYDTSCIEVHLSDGARLLHCASHALDEPVEPLMDIVCDRASIHWEAAGNTAAITYRDGRVERHAGHDGQALRTNLFAQVSRAAGGVDPAPLCGLAEGAPQVLAIDLAYESSAGIATIPGEQLYESPTADGTPVVCVRGMKDLLLQALERGRLFSELGVSWAGATQSVPAAGYERFPGVAAQAGLGIGNGVT